LKAIPVFSDKLLGYTKTI